ncbi:MAG: methyltransferase [Planctomycetota bacterium]
MFSDASNFYALLRYEEARHALMACFKLEIVDQLAGGSFSQQQFCQQFGFTKQGGRTFLHLLIAMDVIAASNNAVDEFQITLHAAECLSLTGDRSRRPYLQMGRDETSDALISMLRGDFVGTSLYGEAGSQHAASLMEDEQTQEIAAEVALGLASRARNFAIPLASCISSVLQELAIDEKLILADIGAGSPYVARACLDELPQIESALLVDQERGLQYANELLKELPNAKGIETCTCNVFESAPAANIYLLSNTAHDWLPEACQKIYDNVHQTALSPSLLVLHEPLLVRPEEVSLQANQALWMACYALALYKLTHGQGTCYLESEHDAMLSESGFERVGSSMPTVDGCTALLYRRK